MVRASLFILVAALPACRVGSQVPAQTAAERAAADSYRASISRDSVAYVRWSLPSLAAYAVGRPQFADKYEVFIGLNPYYQRGLLDEDAIPDEVVQIVEKHTGRRGIAIVRGCDSTVRVLGAGTPFGNGGDDFRWLWVWRIESARTYPGIQSTAREVLLVEKPESAGGVIWWNGSTYVWTQAGD